MTADYRGRGRLQPDRAPDVISGVDIFKIPSLRVSPTYVSERFVERVKAAGLRGLVFNKVWSG